MKIPETNAEIRMYHARALNLVKAYIDDRSPEKLKYEVHLVWFTKTLQNWKAMVSTNLLDMQYYELTYNGDKGETYIDAYRKFDSVTVKDPRTGMWASAIKRDTDG